MNIGSNIYIYCFVFIILIELKNGIIYINIMKDYDVIILVIASRGEIYDKLIDVYWKYFINYTEKKLPNIKIFLLYGSNVYLSDIPVNKNNIIICDTPETYIPGILQKTIYSFNYIKENYKYNHIFRTNLSSFLIIENLINISKSLPKKDCYAGVIGSSTDYNHISGAGIWLSEDNINYLLSNSNKINYNIIDDVEIGYILKDKTKIRLKRYDIVDNNNNNNNNNNNINKNILLDKIIKSHYHIRIKNGIENDKDRNKDLIFMKEFTDILYNEDNEDNNIYLLLLLLLIIFIVVYRYLF